MINEPVCCLFQYGKAADEHCNNEADNIDVNHGAANSRIEAETKTADLDEINRKAP
jgi:hypothetical protein